MRTHKCDEPSKTFDVYIGNKESLQLGASVSSTYFVNLSFHLMTQIANNSNEVWLSQVLFSEKIVPLAVDKLYNSKKRSLMQTNGLVYYINQS